MLAVVREGSVQSFNFEHGGLLQGLLREALGRLEAALVRQGWPVVRGLRPGLAEADIRQQLEAVGMEPHDDVLEVFGWHNGYVQPANQVAGWQGGWITNVHSVISLEIALRTYGEIHDDLKEQLTYETVGAMQPADPHWFPVMRGPGGDVVIYSGNDRDARGTVAFYDPQTPFFEDAGVYRPSSLAEPIEWWVQWLVADKWYYDPQHNDGGPAIRSRLTPDQMTDRQRSSNLAFA